MLILMEDVLCPEKGCWNGVGCVHRLQLVGVSVDRWNGDEIQVVFNYQCVGLIKLEYNAYYRGKNGPVKFEDVRRTLKRVNAPG